MTRRAIPGVQYPLPRTTLGFTTLALLAFCISCSAENTSSGPKPAASGFSNSNAAEKVETDAAATARSRVGSIPTELNNAAHRNTEQRNTENKNTANGEPARTGNEASSPSLAENPSLGENQSLGENKVLELPSLAPLPSAAPLPPVDSVAPSESSTTRNFQVKIVGLQNTRGNCLIAVYASPSGFRNPDVAIAKEAIDLSKNTSVAGQLKNNELVWSFALPPDLDASQNSDPPGRPGSAGNENTKVATPEIRLAITAFHDANENGELDKNAIGIPTEKYGFSNNPAPGFGPPSFDQTAIPLSQWKSRSSPIEIKLR